MNGLALQVSKQHYISVLNHHSKSKVKKLHTIPCYIFHLFEIFYAVNTIYNQIKYLVIYSLKDIILTKKLFDKTFSQV